MTAHLQVLKLYLIIASIHMQSWINKNIVIRVTVCLFPETNIFIVYWFWTDESHTRRSRRQPWCLHFKLSRIGQVHRSFSFNYIYFGLLAYKIFFCMYIYSNTALAQCPIINFCFYLIDHTYSWFRYWVVHTYSTKYEQIREFEAQ